MHKIKYMREFLYLIKTDSDEKSQKLTNNFTTIQKLQLSGIFQQNFMFNLGKLNMLQFISTIYYCNAYL